MKKTLQTTLACAALFLGSYLQTNAQNVPIDFEVGGNGGTWAWSTFENGPNVAPVITANPSVSGINTSATVACFTSLQIGQPWAGFESMHGAGIGTFTLSNSNAIVKVMVYKSVISDVGVKFAIPSGGALVELKKPNTLINQWEELTFDFSGRIGDVNTINQDQIIFFPDFNAARTSDNVSYIDNVTFNAVTVPTTPMIAAPAPTAMAANVMSLFSNSYTNIPMATWATSWSASGYATPMLPNTAGGALVNDTKLYSNLNFVGAEPVALIDATPMNTFNIDVWTPNITAFRVKLVDFGANAAFGGGDDVEHELSFAPTLGAWNTYHIPLSNFTGLLTKGHIGQVIFSGDPSGVGNAYIDNVYFSYEPPVVPMIAAPAPVLPASDVISLFSNNYANEPVDTWRTSWSNATLTDLFLPNTAGGAVTNNTKRYSALDFVGIETTGANLIDATTMNYFNIDVWTPNATAFRVKLVDWGANGVYNGGGDDVEHEISLTPALSGWNTYSIPLSSFTGLTTRAHMAQYILSANPTALADIYVDNVYFSTVVSPLSLNLVSFTGVLNNNTATLKWQTQNEKDMEQFEIEKSVDGVNFDFVGSVKASNTANASYVFNNELNSNGAYYRLKMKETNGNATHSKTVFLQKNTKVDLQVFPNPANTQVSIISSTPLGNVTITNAAGAIVKQITVTNKAYTFDISKLPIGTYYLSASNKSTISFVKQ
jgi:hypothetical protein